MDPDELQAHETTVSSLEARFQAVLGLVRTTPDDNSVELSNGHKLRLYGLYKHVTAGPCDDDKPPSMLNVTAYAKYRAWLSCRDSSREEAMLSYLHLLAKQTNEIGQHCRKVLNDLEGSKALLESPSKPVTVNDAEYEESTSVDSSSNIPNNQDNDLRLPQEYDAMNRRFLGIQPLIPRGQLDISYLDVLYAAGQSIYGLLTSPVPRHYEQLLQKEWPSAVVGLSVRSLLDLYLRVQKYPVGSQVLVCPPITVPGMRAVLEKQHQLQLVPVDGVEQVDCAALESSVTDRTVAILVVHVFGMKVATNWEELHELAVRHKLEVWEDSAESYTGMGLDSSPYVDVNFWSLGFIKTSTALGGGVALVRNQMIGESMRRLQASRYEQQSAGWYLWRICKALVLKAIADQPVVYGLIATACTRIGGNFDDFVSWLLRGFGNGEHWLRQIRYRPSSAMLAVMHRRLMQTRHKVANSVAERRRRCEQLHQVLAGSSNVVTPVFRNNPNHAYWLYPILVDDPDAMCRYLRNGGYDATRGASQLLCIGSADLCPQASRLLRQAVYLPISSPALNGPEITRLGKLLQSWQPGHAVLASRRQERKSSGGSVFSWKVWRVAGISVSLFLLPTDIVFSMAAAIGSFLALFFLGGQALRQCIGSFYVESSDSFARYSYMLDGNLAEDDVDRADPFCEFKLESSLAILSLQSSPDTWRSVLLTGATGFIGSMLLHDLLKHREALSIRRIVIVSRSKRGESAVDRIKRLLDKPMFSFLAKEDLHAFVQVLEGDTTQENIGLRGDDLAGLLQDQSVTHIFHCAASVSFTQTLVEAASANISSALSAQRLACQLSCRKAHFVHISTAFVHGRLSGTKDSPLTEKLHSLEPYDPVEIYKSMCGTQYYASKAMSDLGFPNTYTFSKCVAEHLLQHSAVDTTIIRPSIVGPAIEQPFPGFSGSKPSTIVAAACLYFSYHWNLWSFGAQRVPCIPVDVLSRLILAKTLSCNYESSSAIASNDGSTSSDDDFVKLSRSSSEDAERQPCQAVLYCVHNAAWDVSSSAKTQFTWREYAVAITQAGTILGYVTRPTAYLGLLSAVRLVPGAGLTYPQFQKLHILLVQNPFSFFLEVQRLLGLNTSRAERLKSFLDLPLLFFPFMNTSYHFSSDLVAPPSFSGGRYLFRCVVAAHSFMSRSTTRCKARECTSLQIAGARFSNTSPDCWWASMQPRGGIATRLAAWVLTTLFRLSFSSVTVDAISMGAMFRHLKEETSTLRVVLAPTHRSFFDFLLVSYVVFALPELQIDIPFILAADDFEKLPMVGQLAKILGAFFVKRGQKQIDPSLIEAVRKIPRRSVIEVFIEGTRSRDRRFVQPRTGFLRCLQTIGDDCIIVPVAVSYELIPEQALLSREAGDCMCTRLSTTGLLSWLAVRVSRAWTRRCNLLLSPHPSSFRKLQPEN